MELNEKGLIPYGFESDVVAKIHKSVRQHKHFKSVRRIIGLWIQYRSNQGALVDVRAPFFNPPSKNDLMGFMRFLLKGKVCRVGNIISTRRLKIILNVFNRLLMESTGEPMPRAADDELKRWLNGDPALDASTQALSSPRAKKDLVMGMLYFLWACDTVEFKHPRVRLQLSLTLLILFLGLEDIGVIDTKRVLDIRYGDIKFTVSDGDVERTFSAFITLRNGKRSRRARGKWTIAKVTQNRHSPELCIVTQLLALAVADNALEGVAGVSHLSTLDVPGSGERDIGIRPEMANIALLRLICNDGTVSTSSRYKDMGELYHQFATRASHLNAPPLPGIRKGRFNTSDWYREGNDDDQSPDWLCQTSAELQQSQKANPFNMSREVKASLRYDGDRARIVDLWYGQPAQDRYLLQSFVEPLVSMAERVAADWSYPDALAELDGTCRVCYFRSKGNNSPSDRVDLNLHLVSCAKRERERKHLEWMQYMIPILHPYCIWSECNESLRAQSVFDIAEHIWLHLDRLDGYYACQWGSCAVTESTMPRLMQHLLKTHLVVTPSTLPRTTFCFECRKYFDCVADWETHCKEHVQTLDMLCGSISRRGVVVTPAKCPFCLGDERKPANRRYHQYLRTSDFLVHVATHLARVRHWPLICPHPLCTLELPSSSAFWTHAAKMHRMAVPQAESQAFVVACNGDQGMPMTASADSFDTCEDGVLSTTISGDVAYSSRTCYQNVHELSSPRCDPAREAVPPRAGDEWIASQFDTSTPNEDSKCAYDLVVESYDHGNRADEPECAIQTRMPFSPLETIWEQ